RGKQFSDFCIVTNHGHEPNWPDKVSDEPADYEQSFARKMIDAGADADDDWRQTFEANVNGVFFFSRAAVRSMRTTGGGSIINVASNVGLVGCP
ncbi:SDR family NAD(P)-dependent oxidoreductase, partial [Mesorhizobium sp. M8A.F.Ca.ET.213.01.1.1]|uniref:SDR family NAD(P)-dependent oxidoreductase n=1 Tax=Mesorhizobium sp. M8A.F.Ca.ET.213.01.1.1 TaxID=2563970 RepID=UPI001091F9D6